MSREERLLTAALAYAARGWRLVPLHNQAERPGVCTCQPVRDKNHGGPCPNPGKHPRLVDFSKRASADQAQIREWWGRWPLANIGLICGQESGIWALDTDPRNGGDMSRGHLIVQHGQMPYTVTTQSGGGGTHEIWRWPDFGVPYALELADGLDVIGEGHVLVAPPSLHPSGREYAWAAELGPDEEQVRDAPGWLAGLVRIKVEASQSTAPPARTDSAPVPVEPILAGCGWLRHCRDDAATLTEPEWYAMLSVVGRCIGASDLAHEYSRAHAKYSASDTAAKLRHALQGAGPATCARVRHSLGGSRFCEVCPSAGRIKSPIVLGRLRPAEVLHPADADVPPDLLGAVDPSTASGAEPSAGGPIEAADIDAAVEAAIGANDPMAALAIAPQLAGQSEFTVARVRLRLAGHFGKRLPERVFVQAMKGDAPARGKPRPPAGGGGDNGASGGDWREGLLRSRDGKPVGNLANAIHALAHAPQWADAMAWDEFANRTVVRRQPPIAVRPEGPWENLHDIRTAEWLQRAGIEISVQVTTMAVEAVAHMRPFHPVREYLCGLKWDGTLRLDQWVPKYLGVGAGDSVDAKDWRDRHRYFENAGAKWMISAVARILRPGCKADAVLIIEGEQGKRKSSALRVLGGEWFTDQIEELGSKDAALALQGAWLVEIAELESMSKAEVGAVKAFFSRARDRYRPPYSARVIEVARQCVFAGTVNGSMYLRDETGGRRFWPVWSGGVDLAALERDRDQLWAEAKFQYDEGRTWWLDVEDVARVAEAEQADRYRGDPWDAMVLSHIEGMEEVTMGRLLGSQCLDIPISKQGQADYNRVSAILRSAGWRKVRSRGRGGIREYVYRPTGQAAQRQAELVEA